MKKLMFAAAAAVMVAGVASAACQYEPLPTAWVYQWKFTGKTTTGVAPKAAKSVAGLCGYTGGGSTAKCAVRTPASLKIEGYTWICEPGCGSDAFEQFAEVNEIFWQKKPFKASLSGGVSGEISNIIGKNAKEYETAGTASFTENVENTTYTLTYAGFGKYDQKNSRVKSCKGNFAGILSQPWYIASKDCVPAGYWDCATLGLVCPGGATAAFGKWSVKFNSSASKKYLNKGIVDTHAPNWVQYLNGK